MTDTLREQVAREIHDETRFGAMAWETMWHGHKLHCRETAGRIIHMVREAEGEVLWEDETTFEGLEQGITVWPAEGLGIVRVIVRAVQAPPA